MVVNRPSIIVYTDHPDEDLLKEVLAGIEEEGVLYQVSERNGDLDTLAFEAAAESMLGSGIGILGNRMAMQMQRLPKGHNVFELDSPRFWQCRNLGANSARAIKKMPFRPLYG
ncbi:MAG: glycerol dehydratase reactivase beta/small subunit family protein [Blautia sp.]|nr:glycerol dehydratase reactivase beta/small subunit family protein [Blautia sp.]